MTQHDDVAYLGQMLETALGALLAVDGISYEEFTSDANLKFALAHRVQIIGEAARRVSSSTQQAIDLPWSEIIGMRNKIVHDYLGVDFDLIWKTVIDDLPGLTETLQRTVRNHESGAR
jgi:uncharacterized protein with HEPN domain